MRIYRRINVRYRRIYVRINENAIQLLSSLTSDESEILYQMISVIIVAFLKCLPGKVLLEIRLKSEILYQMISVIIVAYIHIL